MVEQLPEFTDDGLLPPGDYELTLDELRASLLVAGPADRQRFPHWDEQWRAKLVDNLETALAGGHRGDLRERVVCRGQGTSE